MGGGESRWRKEGGELAEEIAALRLEEIRSHVPAISAWMENCYGAQPILRLGEDTILSCCGVQQGDPLGPLGFALTLQPITQCIKAEVPGLRINVWYLND